MKIAYRIVTGLMAALIFFSAVPNILMNEMAVSGMKYLGYPVYLLPFIGTLKILAVITILLPGFRLLKEWAYAGLVIDLTGAIYSLICVGTSLPDMMIPIVALILVMASYLLYRKKQSTNEYRIQPQL